MKNILIQLLLLLTSFSVSAQVDQVEVVKNNQGMTLQVNGAEFMVNGMNWDYFPIGTNFSYSLWNQPDDIIKAALDSEMSMLKNMGVNAIRVYTGVQPRWIEYIYEKYGIQRDRDEETKEIGKYAAKFMMNFHLDFGQKAQLCTRLVKPTNINYSKELDFTF